MKDSDQLLKYLQKATVSVAVPVNFAIMLTTLLMYRIGDINITLDKQGNNPKVSNQEETLKWTDLRDIQRLERERYGLSKYDDWEEDLEDTDDKLSF